MDSWFSEALRLSLYGLAIAIVCYIAVHLIESVWLGLVVILGVGGCVMLTVALLRYRRRHW
jgi:hypothetical protein